MIGWCYARGVNRGTPQKNNIWIYLNLSSPNQKKFGCKLDIHKLCLQSTINSMTPIKRHQNNHINPPSTPPIPGKSSPDPHLWSQQPQKPNCPLASSRVTEICPPSHFHPTEACTHQSGKGLGIRFQHMLLWECRFLLARDRKTFRIGFLGGQEEREEWRQRQGVMNTGPETRWGG